MGATKAWRHPYPPKATAASPVGGTASDVHPGDVAGPGVSTSVARIDHLHGLPAGTPVTVGSVNAPGTANTVARADHVHAAGPLIYAIVRSDVPESFVSNAERALKLNVVNALAGLTYDGTTNELVVVTAGVYEISGEVTWDVNNTGVRGLSLIKNYTNGPSGYLILSNCEQQPGNNTDTFGGASAAQFRQSNLCSTRADLIADDRISLVAVIAIVSPAAPAPAAQLSTLAHNRYSPLMTMRYVGPSGPFVGDFIVTPLNTALGTARNNFSGRVGFSFTTDTAGLTVSHLARFIEANNTQPHTVELLTTTGTVLGSVSVPSVGSTFNYVALGSPVTLAANTTYYLMSTEVSGGDLFIDKQRLINRDWSYSGSAKRATINGDVYQTNSTGAFTVTADPGKGFPVSMRVT